MHRFADQPELQSDVAEESAAAGQDEEYLLTPAEARMAATLALMTGFSHGCCAAHRAPMAAKVAEQLAHLACAPAVSDDMRALLLGLRQRWQTTAAQAAAQGASNHPREPDAENAARGQTNDFPSPHVLWHAPLETLQ